MNLNELAAQCHAANIKWWQNIDTGEPLKRNRGELIALIHSEISEGYEGEMVMAMDDKLPLRLMGEVELADAVIRILDYATGFYHDLGSAGLKFGVSEFIDLNHFIKCANRSCIEGYPHHARIHSQISKVLELERKDKPSEQVAEALVVVLIHIFEYAFRQGYDLMGAFREKMAFNKSRIDHTHEARRIAGGKRF